MDHRLVTWARAVKARSLKTRALRDRECPVLWLFTDTERLPDPRAAIVGLPRGLCGVVFRHDGAPDRAAMARAVAALCRAGRVKLVVAGDWRLASAVGAGMHLRAGRSGVRRLRRGEVVTSSAHSAPELRRAWRAGAGAVFVSPLAPTDSHRGAPALGAARWARLTLGQPGTVLALGGVDGRTARRLPVWCGGAGAISAFWPG